MKPVCALCGSRHELYQAHVFATNTSATNRGATNSATNVATNDGREGLRVSSPGRMGCDEPALEITGPGIGGEGKTANRRSREAYNAYQREYMRKKRGNPTIHD